MALANTNHFSIISGSTASNVNGGGFNIANANFLTDLTTDTGTGNTSSPIVSSATYTFVAGDVGAWVYVASGTDWTVGWYQIASVSAGKATLTASVGTAVAYDSASETWIPNTTAGCATVGTPTGGTFGIDYSQGTAAIATATNLTCTAGSTTVTSASGLFTRMMVGNLIHLTALTGTGAIVGWYELVNYTDANNVVLDRTPTNGVNNITAGTFYVGGAMSLNSTLDDELFEVMLAGNVVWVKGSLTLGESISVSATPAGTVTNHGKIIGYSSVRGDNPTGGSRPTVSNGASSFLIATRWDVYNLIVTGTTTTTFSSGTSGTLYNCKFINTSTTADRTGVAPSTSILVDCEAISYRGYACTVGSTTTTIDGCYFHDSNYGLRFTAADSTGFTVMNTIISDNVSGSISMSGAAVGRVTYLNNTLYGASTPRGVGIGCVTGTGALALSNNIIYGFVSGVSLADAQNFSLSVNNNFYNNTTDRTNWNTSSTDKALDPQFTNVGYLSGSTATTSGSVLTQSGADFSSVTDGVDFVYIPSGTGITPGKYPITSHTTTTLTLGIAPGTNATADKVWNIVTGHDFSIGTNLKAQGFPGAFQAGLTTGYLDIGAVQRQEAGGGGSSSYTFS